MTDPTTSDLLREVCDAWDSFYDNASGWQERVDAAVYRARAHLNPVLEVDTDPPPSPRSLASTDRVGLRGQEAGE